MPCRYHGRTLNHVFDFQCNPLRIVGIWSYYTKASDSVKIVISYSSGIIFSSFRIYFGEVSYFAWFHTCSAHQQTKWNN